MQKTDITEPLEIEVGLYLIGDFRPDEIGRAFDVVPTVAVAKGAERRRKSTGAVLGIYKEATWGFTSGQAVQSNEISDHVTWLIGKSSAARSLINQSVHTFIEISLQDGTSCVLPESLLGFAREMGAEIGIAVRTSHVA